MMLTLSRSFFFLSLLLAASTPPLQMMDAKWLIINSHTSSEPYGGGITCIFHYVHLPSTPDSTRTRDRQIDGQTRQADGQTDGCTTKSEFR